MAGTPILKHTWGTTVKNDSGSTQLNDSFVVVGSNEFNETITINPGATAEIDCGSIAHAKMVSFYMVSSQASSVATNASDGTGGQVIALTANKGYAWNNTQVASNPITADITKIFVTNNGAAVATFKAAFLLNLLV